MSDHRQQRPFLHALRLAALDAVRNPWWWLLWILAAIIGSVAGGLLT